VRGESSDPDMGFPIALRRPLWRTLMEQNYKREIEEIVSQTPCPKNFRCYEQGFRDLCPVRDIGLELFVICLDSSPNGCTFSVRYGYSNYCRCPLRVYVAKQFKM
jgi:hypothetical protein